MAMFGTPSVKMVVAMLVDAERRKPGTLRELVADVGRELAALPETHRDTAAEFLAMLHATTRQGVTV